MFSFKGFFTKEKNTHLEHVEDDIINRGSKGGKNALNFLKSIRNMLAGSAGKKVNMSVKWDGAPAIICGINPENGQFFVGTKAVFNVNPKINYTSSDIRRNHSGELANKLNIALRELKKLNISGILQGDFLFSKSDLKTASIDGENMITFTPNTITYAVPVDSDIGKRIKRARMGIVFHTSYSGKTMKDLKAGPMLDEMSKTTSDSLSVGFRLKTFFNHYIRNTQGNMAKVKTLVDMFREYYQSVLQAEIDAKKTDSGKQKYKNILNTNLRFIDRNKQALYFAIASHVTLQNAKNFLVSKLSEIQSIGHFLRTPNGYRVTAPEGFVAVDRVAGAVKLVDRLEFSRANFTAEKDWVKG